MAAPEAPARTRAHQAGLASPDNKPLRAPRGSALRGNYLHVSSLIPFSNLARGGAGHTAVGWEGDAWRSVALLAANRPVSGLRVIETAVFIVIF